MGLVYTVLMQDDFDWKYVRTNKAERMEKIRAELEEVAGFAPDVLADWYGHMVLDCEKTPVYLEPYKSIILKNCDTAIYWTDSEPYKKTTL